MFSNALTITGSYSNEDILLFEKEVKFRHLHKEEIIIQNGEVARSVFFILTGSIYQYNLKSEIEYNIIDLYTENEWFLNHKSFVLQKPSDSIIATFRESTLLELSVESIHYLISKSQAFFQLNSILERATSRVYFFDNLLTPTDKYQFLMENKPQLIQEFPLKMIASYLKITPETLSRARAKFARHKSIS